MRDRGRLVGALVMVTLTVAGCGGSADGDGEAASTTSTTEAAAPTTTEAPATTTTSEAPATTTTTTEAPTTTVAAFDIETLDEVSYGEANFTCAWATDVPQQPNGQLFSNPDLSFLRNQLATGFAIEPFLAATADIDVTAASDDELKAALADACVEIGAPTESYLAQFQ